MKDSPNTKTTDEFAKDFVKNWNIRVSKWQDMTIHMSHDELTKRVKYLTDSNTQLGEAVIYLSLSIKKLEEKIERLENGNRSQSNTFGHPD